MKEPGKKDRPEQLYQTLFHAPFLSLSLLCLCPSRALHAVYGCECTCVRQLAVRPRKKWTGPRVGKRRYTHPREWMHVYYPLGMSQSRHDGLSWLVIYQRLSHTLEYPQKGRRGRAVCGGEAYTGGGGGWHRTILTPEGDGPTCSPPLPPFDTLAHTSPHTRRSLSSVSRGTTSTHYPTVYPLICYIHISYVHVRRGCS